MGSLLGDMPDLGGPSRRQAAPDLGDDILAIAEGGAAVDEDVAGGFSWDVDPSADAEGKKRKKGKKKSKSKDKKKSSRDKKKKSRSKGDAAEDGERPSTAGSAGSAAATAPAPVPEPAEDSYDPDLPTTLGADFFSDAGGGSGGGGSGGTFSMPSDSLSAFTDAQTAATQGRRSRAGRRSAADGTVTGGDDALGGLAPAPAPASDPAPALLGEDLFEKRAREARERAAQQEKEKVEREQREKLEREQREREQREKLEREQSEREQREREQREREQREKLEREQQEREQREREQKEREQEEARRQREADELREEQRRRDMAAAAGPGSPSRDVMESSLDATAASDQLNESLGEELMAKMFGGPQIPVTKTGAEDAPAAGIAVSAPRPETDESRPGSGGSRPGSAESRRPSSRGRDSGNIRTGKEVRATFIEEGKFGITFGSVPNSNPGPMKINKIDPSGLAAAQPQLTPGLVLIAVQGRPLQGKSREEASSIMKNTSRPITMTFVEADLPDFPKTAASAAPAPAPASIPAPAPTPTPAPAPSPTTAVRNDGLSDVESWYRWLGVDPKHDPNAVVVYAQEAAKQRAPHPWVLRNGMYINEETGDKQAMHPLVDTLKPRVESLRAVTSSTISDRSDNETSIGGRKSGDQPSSPSAKAQAFTPTPAPAPASSATMHTSNVAQVPKVTGVAQPSEYSAPTYGEGDDELRRRVAQLEADLRSAHLAKSTAERSWFDERRTLTDQLEHATLRAQTQYAQSSGNEDVQKLIAEKNIFIEKSHADKKRYEDLRARYDAMQSEHQDEIERLNDQHRKELATARAGKNELMQKLAAAEAAASGEGSMLHEVTSKIQAALNKLQNEATGNRAVEEQITAAVQDIRQDMKARRDLEARALGEDSSRTSLVLSSLDLKMQEMQAHQAEMQRRQAEEAVRLQAERRRLDVLQESMTQERKLALDTFNAELRDIQADRDKHLREHEDANRALLEERRRLNMERESAMAETAAKERELTDIAREQAEKASQLASEQSALKYERKMADREREEMERERETLDRQQAQVAADRAQIEAYSAKLNDLGKEIQRRSADLADKQATHEREALAASRALAEAKEIEQRAEQLSAAALQKEQASAAQSLSVNRERLQLATEQRDITELRQEAERQAAEAKDRSQQLEQEIAKLQRQLAGAGSKSSRDREGKRRSAKSVPGSWTRMANKENDDAQLFRTLKRSTTTSTGLSWEDDHARTQQLLREQARFMEQLKQRPTERQRDRTRPEPYSPEPHHRSSDLSASHDTSVNRTLDYDDQPGPTEKQRQQPLQHESTAGAPMPDHGGNHTATSSLKQDTPSDPSSNNSSVYSFPNMVEVDVSTSSVLSDRGTGAAAASNMDRGPSVLSDAGTSSPGEALRAASLAAAQ